MQCLFINRVKWKYGLCMGFFILCNKCLVVGRQYYRSGPQLKIWISLCSKCLAVGRNSIDQGHSWRSRWITRSRKEGQQCNSASLVVNIIDQDKESRRSTCGRRSPTGEHTEAGVLLEHTQKPEVTIYTYTWIYFSSYIQFYSNSLSWRPEESFGISMNHKTPAQTQMPTLSLM